MQTRVFENSQLLAEMAAGELMALIERKPNALICLPTGNSPKATYTEWVRIMKTTQTDTRSLFLIGLDEWVGIPPETEGSCAYEMRERVFHPLGIKEEQYHLFDGMSSDLSAECKKMDTLIRERGGIDLMFVGIGMNGHIGFNEPGTPFGSFSHVRELDSTTTSVGQQYFQQPQQINRGITLGPAQVLAARRVILLAQGSKKAALIQRTVMGIPDPEFPATMLQLHPHAELWLDREAASGLQYMY